MVHDLSHLDFSSHTPGSGDIADEQGLQLEESENKVIPRDGHFLFGRTPTQAYTEHLGKEHKKKPFHFTVEGLEKTSILQCTLYVEPHTNITIVEHIRGQELVVFSLFLFIGEGATVTYVREPLPDLPVCAAVYRKATLQKNATLTWFDTVYQEKEIISETTTHLAEEGSSVEVKGLVLATGDQLHDTFHHTIHEAPYTTSHTHIRIILGGHARHLGRTETTILPHAYHSKAREEMHTLITSPNAKSQTVPDLDIQENDVQCSHAVTTTHLSPEKMFYLSSRGIDEHKATALALEAHIVPVVPPLHLASEYITRFISL
jgi:Fe-S cluster assembly scaffold protein SufB